MKFRARCSKVGDLMGVKGLGKTGQSYVEQWYKEQLYERRKEFTSRYTQKGIINEDESIDLISQKLNVGILLKNEQYFENEFLTGTPDVITDVLIIDAKSSWDCFTFPLFESELPEKKYYWQMQGYMDLTGKESAKVCYVLTDTPMNIIDKEFYYHCQSNGYDNNDLELYNEFIQLHKYSHLDSKLRVKVYDVPRSDSDIELMHQRITEANEYLQKILIK